MMESHTHAHCLVQLTRNVIVGRKEKVVIMHHTVFPLILEVHRIRSYGLAASLSQSLFLSHAVTPPTIF